VGERKFHQKKAPKYLKIWTSSGKLAGFEVKIWKSSGKVADFEGHILIYYI
jgi:hypothetical protein